MPALIPGKLLHIGHRHTASNATHEALMTLPGAIHVPRTAKTTRTILWTHPAATGNEAVISTVRNPLDLIVTNWLKDGFGLHLAEHIRTMLPRPDRLWAHLDLATHIMRWESLQADLDSVLDELELPRVKLPRRGAYVGKLAWPLYHCRDSVLAMNERFGEETSPFYEPEDPDDYPEHPSITRDEVWPPDLPRKASVPLSRDA